MTGRRLFPTILLTDYVLVLLFCTSLSLATGLMNEENHEPKDVSIISALNVNSTDTPTNRPAPSLTQTPTPTVFPTETPTVRFTPTERPTKAPYVFPRPIYTREKP